MAQTNPVVGARDVEIQVRTVDLDLEDTKRGTHRFWRTVPKDLHQSVPAKPVDLEVEVLWLPASKYVNNSAPNEESATTRCLNANGNKLSSFHVYLHSYYGRTCPFIYQR